LYSIGSLTVNGEESELPLHSNVEQQSGEVKFTWEPAVNRTRQVMHMNHLEMHRLTMEHRYYRYELWAAQLHLGHAQYEYYFVDMAMSLTAPFSNDCLEGVWGRTTCVSSAQAPVNGDYDLHGDIFSVRYPKSQFMGLP
jgi:hypothetical protein